MIRPKCKTLNPCKYRVPLYGECGYQGFCQYKTNGRKNMKEYTVRVYDSKTEWYLNNKLHREGGLPAIEWANGDKSWYMNDKLHRVDGPAIECANGNKHWWLNNKRHRTDGPAVEWANGEKQWFLDGKEVTEKEFLNKTVRDNAIYWSLNGEITEKEPLSRTKPKNTELVKCLKQLLEFLKKGE